MTEVPDIVTPCCGAPLLITTTSEGSAYLQYEVPSEILCMGDKCYNSWLPSGKSDDYNRMPDER